MTRPAVLVVEDDFLVRLHTADTLRDAGFEVVEASDAANALALLQEMPCFQLICTDVQMPGELDGIDLALRVRERHPEMRVIIMSSHSGHSDRLPSAPFLSKPFQASRLVDLARRELAAMIQSARTPL
jgi:DNA-binding NtrC family response regulator